jgi:biopolymer transport protein ExbB
LKQRIEQSGHPADALAALDATEIFLARLRRQLGGYTTPGTSLRDGDNLVHKGTFAYLGPDVFFRSDNGDVYGTVRERKDSPYVVTYRLKTWDAAQAGALMRGEVSAVPADVSGGKALRLLDTKGGLWTELKKGGVVGYVIMGLGVVALLIIGMKLLDLQQLDVDSPSVMFAAASAVARGARAEAEAALPKLKRTTRELFATGLRYMDGPRTLLEEQFEGFVLRNRLQQERRLPLLAVIATAGPLLGLLGTVTGMIKTFTLITVFGTGSAGRLSGGISEALVATALGLAVAIPTLVVHGFLSHRIHKGLGLLERYSLEFVTAVEEDRAARNPPTLSK